MTEVQRVPETLPGSVAPSGMEAAFEPPDIIQDNPNLISLYHEIIDRLRTESMGIPMHTAQEILLERIATKYILIKHRESTGWAGLGATAEDKANTQWLDMLKEWNRVLAQGHEQLRDAVLRETEQIAVDAINLVPDPEIRQVLRLHFKERYAAMGH